MKTAEIKDGWQIENGVFLTTVFKARQDIVLAGDEFILKKDIPDLIALLQEVLRIEESNEK